ncbi:TPA: hypothetical protein MCI55_001646 [Klebsiella pneumoniae]|nr:hypothetical protein [Klebsiella pneumoniae]
MNIKKALTYKHFLAINNQLANASDTWADLWVLVFHTRLSAGRLLTLRYEDISEDSMLIRECGRLKELRVELTSPIKKILNCRREKYQGDVFVFQSHSNRVKYECRPVTLIAFNTALSRAANSLPGVTVSSSSARNVIGKNP